MAIGDAVAAYMGTAATNRQPSAGVEEQISGLIKSETTDSMNIYDGSTEYAWYGAAIRTDVVHGDAAATRNGPFNMALMITNSVYLRKGGTSNRVVVFGVQTNS